MSRFTDLGYAIKQSMTALKYAKSQVDAGHWQGIPTEGRPDLETKEIVNLAISAPMYPTIQEAQDRIEPNLPWAEDHFQERVSRVPSNPGEEYKNWPWWRGQVELTDAKMRPTYDESGTKQLTNFRFTHTYQERFWPKYADLYTGGALPKDGPHFTDPVHTGIRYNYGDLDDVVNLLYKYPYTRQATFPIFFPEDTGAVHGGRIPCTLHYHFLLREYKLHMWYAIRSCDAIRHFRDDVYLANRLCQWVIEQLQEKELREPDYDQVWVDVVLGDLHFTAYSFHVHAGDFHLL